MTGFRAHLSQSKMIAVGEGAWQRRFLAASFRNLAYAASLAGLIAWLLAVELTIAMETGTPHILPLPLVDLLFFSPAKWAFVVLPFALARLADPILELSRRGSGIAMLYGYAIILGLAIACLTAPDPDIDLAVIGPALVFGLAGCATIVSLRSLPPETHARGMIYAGLSMPAAALAHLWTGDGPVMILASLLALAPACLIVSTDIRHLRRGYTSIREAGASSVELARYGSHGALIMIFRTVAPVVTPLRWLRGGG